MKGLPKTKRCNSVAVTVSVRFRFGFGVYVKQPLGLSLANRDDPSIVVGLNYRRPTLKLKVREEFCHRGLQTTKARTSLRIRAV